MCVLAGLCAGAAPQVYRPGKKVRYKEGTEWNTLDWSEPICWMDLPNFSFKYRESIMYVL